MDAEITEDAAAALIVLASYGYSSFFAVVDVEAARVAVDATPAADLVTVAAYCPYSCFVVAVAAALVADCT